MPLSQEDLERIREEAERYKEAIVNTSNTAVELWHARIDMIMAAGGVESVDDIIARPEPFWGNNNCDCRSFREPELPV